MSEKFSLDKISLRKKIVLLALIPALAACLIFALLVATSSHDASKLVRTNITDFMVERTLRSLTHGYASSVVALSFIRQIKSDRLHFAMYSLAAAILLFVAIVVAQL